MSTSLRLDARLEEARAWYERARECSPVGSFGTLMSHACFALLDGDLDEAERRSERSLEVVPPDLARLYHGAFFLVVEALRGRTHPDLLRPHADVRSFAGVGALSLLAVGAVLDDELAEARRALSEARDRFDRIARMLVGATTLARFAEVADACGDDACAAELLEVLEPLAGGLAEDGVSLWCSIDHARALLLLATGDAAGATAVAEGAVEASRHRGTPIFLGRELVVLARARRDLGAGSDDLRPLIAEALTIADDTGAAIIRTDLGRFDLADIRAGSG